jgi:O-acetyl-ADP-ribose deacetylase (regulator of RNase III)
MKVTLDLAPDQWRSAAKRATMKLEIIDGDLLQQDVEVIVNAWNRNIIPWWLLLPQGVSGAIKKLAGLQPFRELGRKGVLSLGSAVETSAGHLPYRAIIHVAGINLFWRSSEVSVRDSVRNAMALAKTRDYKSIAFPLIGAGSGGSNGAKVLKWMIDELLRIEFNGEVRVIRYKKTS